MDKDIIQLKNTIEALLFAWGEPIDIKDISNYFNINLPKAKEVIEILKYEYQSRGVRIQTFGSQVQINTNPDYHAVISNFGLKQRKKNLSNAAMETLSIIAYLQPTTKSVIEKIRGVNSDGSIKTLLDRDLIREAGKLNQPGKPFIYKTTDNFLKNFEIENVQDLPDLVDRDEILQLLKISEIDFNDFDESELENRTFEEVDSEIE